MARPKKIKLTPGTKAPVSGQYSSSEGGEVTGVKGKRLPPGPKGSKNVEYVLVDKTKSRKRKK